MRFNLQDVKKSIQRRGGMLTVSLHFLQPGELHHEIERLIAYHESLLGQRHSHFSPDEARACIGDYRLAYCLLATLSSWYSWRQREWQEVVQELGGSPALAELTSPAQLRLALYSYVNEHAHGFLGAQQRTEALQAFADLYQLSVPILEYLLALDSEAEEILVRTTAQPPQAQEVATRYNQWAFEAALFSASNVHFVIDCAAFNRVQAQNGERTPTTVGTGAGAAIKRLCYLARRLGVYYDLAYDTPPAQRPGLLVTENEPARLHLTLYGPQEVTGAAQQYGVRLARLCRLLLGYSSKNSGQGRAKRGNRPSLSSAVVEAEATVHFLQRTYNFHMDANLLQLLPPVVDGSAERESANVSSIFDSSIEQAFCESFVALANSQGVDGWRLEREPEPLLLDSSIFIPDFALTRGRRRIYVEILGFWTPSYRERKVQKLRELQGRDDLLLAIPVEARDAFAEIAPHFPVVYYRDQLALGEVLQLLRTRYDDFAERLEEIDIAGVRAQVRHQGILPEQACYSALHCYRRSEIPLAAERIVNEEIAFLPGIGLYCDTWLEEVKIGFLQWIGDAGSARLGEVVEKMKRRWPVLAACDSTTIETMLALWSQVQVRRDSIFEAVVELSGGRIVEEEAETEAHPGTMEPKKSPKKQVRERRPALKKRASEQEMVQGDLWG